MADHLNPNAPLHTNAEPEDDRLATSRRDFLGLSLAAGSGALLWPIFAPLAHAQRAGVFCAPVTGKDLVNPGEIVRDASGFLRGVINLHVEKRSITYYQGNGGYVCFQPTLRAYEGYQGWTLDPAKKVTINGTSGPGPTLRARVGDTIELMFLNRVDQAQFQATSLTSVKSAPNKCDTVLNQDGTEAYPAKDAGLFPNCFHASNTSNLHFHGTHTNPDDFGDNVLIGVLPNPRMDAQAAIEMGKRAYAQWDAGQNPSKWLVEESMTALKVMHAAAVAAKNDNLATQLADAIHTNETNLAAGEWPQYWPGFYPHFFGLPQWSGSLQKYPRMGQSPGTHWYHCHQHGSTALQLINGMAGLFIITGSSYDDYILRLGGGTPEKPKIKERVMIFQIFGEQPQQLQASPSTNQITVNGQVVPTVTMAKGEVQWWRIGDAAMKAHGVGDFAFFDEATYLDYVANPNKLKAPLIAPKARATMAPLPNIDPNKVPNLYQTAQDGVQLAWKNFQALSKLTVTQQAPGNRADFLVKAPNVEGTSYLVFWFSPGGPPAPPDIRQNLVLKVVTKGNPDGVNTALPTEQQYPPQPGFLTDITDAEIEGRHRTLRFSMHGGIGSQPIFKIDGEQFQEGRIDQLILLENSEEWTIENWSGRSVMHPFHIHINPFQVTEIFDPLTMTEPLELPQPWVWWDVFPIPAGVQEYVVNADGTVTYQFDPVTNLPKLKNGPGWIKIRSRFVDYPGTYVLHCHILGHEDRGMMQLVKVVDNKTVVKHH
jgi:FtsP/CotA-like multicopper oxidase with cupredoxin domain